MVPDKKSTPYTVVSKPYSELSDREKLRKIAELRADLLTKATKLLTNIGVPKDRTERAVAAMSNGSIKQKEDTDILKQALNNIGGQMKNNPLSLWNTVPAAMLVAGGITAGAPILTGNLVSGATGLTTYLSTIGGAVAGGKAVDNATKKIWGKDFGSLLGNHLGINNEVASYFNPGYEAGGIAGNTLGKITHWFGRMSSQLPKYVERRKSIFDKSSEPPITNAPWYSPFEYIIGNSNIGKRTIETVMRTTSESNPLPFLKRYLYDNVPKRFHQYIPNKFLEKPPTYYGEVTKTYHKPTELLNYIFRNKRTKEGNIPNFYPKYNGKFSEYNGVFPSIADEIFGGVPDHSLQHDVIRAILYGTHPGKGFVETQGYGIHRPYIEERYSHKGPLRVFELSPDSKHYGKVAESVNPENFGERQIESTESAILFGDDHLRYNASGHRVEKLPAKDFPYSVVRELDMYKFNPIDYMKKWFPNMTEPTKEAKLMDFGIHAVDEATNPIIVRSPWYKKMPVTLESIVIPPEETPPALEGYIDMGDIFK